MSKKIGQIIRLKEDIELKSTFGDEVTKVCKGDKAVITSQGSILFLTGNARGSITPPDDTMQVKGYDVDSITEIIMKEIGSLLDSYCDDEDLEIIQDSIEIVLEDILL